MSHQIRVNSTGTQCSLLLPDLILLVLQAQRQLQISDSDCRRWIHGRVERTSLMICDSDACVRSPSSTSMGSRGSMVET